jgi:ribosome-binding protein aMBF1 (putative translation factor)
MELSNYLRIDAAGYPVEMTPGQSRAARALLTMTQADLAARARISTTALRNFESGSVVPQRNNMSALETALEAAGVMFIEADASGGPGVRLRT